MNFNLNATLPQSSEKKEVVTEQKTVKPKAVKQVARDKAIKNCITCKGNPEEVTSHIPGFDIVYCKQCMEIIQYHKL